MAGGRRPHPQAGSAAAEHTDRGRLRQYQSQLRGPESESASFIAAQEAFKTASIDQVNDLKVELTYKLDAYKKASEQTMLDANAALQTKEKMESAMRLMLKDIVDTSVVAMDAVGSNAATMMTTTPSIRRVRKI